MDKVSGLNYSTVISNHACFMFCMQVLPSLVRVIVTRYLFNFQSLLFLVVELNIRNFSTQMRSTDFNSPLGPQRIREPISLRNLTEKLIL
jgi:hypothetical protein